MMFVFIFGLKAGLVPGVALSHPHAHEGRHARLADGTERRARQSRHLLRKRGQKVREDTERPGGQGQGEGDDCGAALGRQPTQYTRRPVFFSCLFVFCVHFWPNFFSSLVSFLSQWRRLSRKISCFLSSFFGLSFLCLNSRFSPRPAPLGSP